MVGAGRSLGNRSTHISSLPCSTPGFSGLYKALVSRCSGTSLQPPGISSQCFKISRARCSLLGVISPVGRKVEAHKNSVLMQHIPRQDTVRFIGVLSLDLGGDVTGQV